MARTLRLEYPGACYYVMNRASARRRVFRAAADCKLFLDKLSRISEAFGVRVRAYCLMPDRFHLYLCTPEGNLSRFMQGLLAAFAMAYKSTRRSSGPIFQGRFRAVLVEDEAYGSQVSRYVHLNPVRARGVKRLTVGARRKILRRYRWSSYASVMGLRRCPSWLDRDSVLADWGRRQPAASRRYAAYVEEGLVRALANPLKAATAGAVLGTAAFVRRVRRGLRDVRAKRRVRRRCGQAPAEPAWVSLEELIELVAAAFRTDQARLLRRHSRSNDPRQVLLYLASLHCRGRYTLTELGERLGGITVAALARARDKMAERLARERDLRRRVSRLEKRLTERR